MILGDILRNKLKPRSGSVGPPHESTRCGGGVVRVVELSIVRRYTLNNPCFDWRRAIISLSVAMLPSTVVCAVRGRRMSTSEPRLG